MPASGTETLKSAALCPEPSIVDFMSKSKLEVPEDVGECGHMKRLTLDLSREEHRALKLISVERDMPMAELLRGAIAELQRDEGLLDRVVLHAS